MMVTSGQSHSTCFSNSNNNKIYLYGSAYTQQSLLSHTFLLVSWIPQHHFSTVRPPPLFAHQPLSPLHPTSHAKHNPVNPNPFNTNKSGPFYNLNMCKNMYCRNYHNNWKMEENVNQHKL